MYRDYHPYDIPYTNPPLQLRFGTPEARIPATFARDILQTATIELGKMDPNERVPEAKELAWQQGALELSIQNVSRSPDFTVAVAIKIVKGYATWLGQREQVLLARNQVFRGSRLYASMALLAVKTDGGVGSEAVGRGRR